MVQNYEGRVSQSRFPQMLYTMVHVNLHPGKPTTLRTQARASPVLMDTYLCTYIHMHVHTYLQGELLGLSCLPKQGFWIFDQGQHVYSCVPM